MWEWVGAWGKGKKVIVCVEKSGVSRGETRVTSVWVQIDPGVAGRGGGSRSAEGRGR